MSDSFPVQRICKLLSLKDTQGREKKKRVNYLYRNKTGDFFRRLPIYLWDRRHFLYTFVQRSKGLPDACEHVLMVEDIYVLCLADNALGPCVAGKDEGGPESNGEPGSPICSAKKWALWFQ